MNWFIKIINKLFLVKEIRSKEGELHFLRYRLFSCPWLRLYIHKICRSDLDAHLHTHPWNFYSFILKGGYVQEIWADPFDNSTTKEIVNRFDTINMTRHRGHKITLTQNPTWTFVVAYGEYGRWGYLTNSGYVDHAAYRDLKNKGMLPK